MTIKFAKRVAASIMRRGVNAIRIKPGSYDEVDKALTRDDVRKLIGTGSVFAVGEKHNASTRSKRLHQKRSEGRSRGPGWRRGTQKARRGRVWEKKVRSQRLFLKKLKSMGKVDTKTFNRLYGQIKGNAYASKGALVLHLEDQGIKISEDEMKQISEHAKANYR
ncbi:MAG: 50S ribosomal protein L19e [Candidatus Marsarchaeota archaeon]|jgi:Ribosomal protein L19E|nr:50S ribosomal protein L19e [Candidatus Marsarchaeota archaeon]MCL5419305.1 50S ribosomal protein L19e [Candidatus Marsarchaeota archaeon]